MRSPLPRPVLVAVVCALLAGLAVEAAPVVGGDLVAQAWWASWASSVGRPVDLGWYGGVPVASYSLLGPWLGSAFGLPLVGIGGTVLGAASTTALLGRLRPSPGRWAAAGVVSAVLWAASQWSGRTTFGAGAALGCLALVIASGTGRRRSVARVCSAVVAALAGAVSPLASAFLLIAVAAWWLGPGGRSVPLRARPAGAWWVAGGAVLPVVAAWLLGAVSGAQPTSAHQMVAALAACALTGVLVARRCRVLRIGAALTWGVLLVTWVVDNPVGSNSTRLVLLFAVPVLVAAARTPPPVTVLACLGVVWLLPPLVVSDLGSRDLATAARTDALVTELARLGPVGRVEVVPLHGHEESIEVARRVPLARGWLRQLDTARGALFYADRLDARQYVQWLHSAGVSYVALPSGRVDWPAHPEVALLRHGVGGLPEVWSDRWWRLYRVPGGSLVRGGELVSSDRSAVVLDVASARRVEVALWWSRWSSVEGPGGCVRAGTRDGWTTLEVRRPGRYVVTSSWHPVGRCA